MRLAISNIAWDTSEDEEIAQMLKRYGVDAIDIAPGKYFPEPDKATDEEIVRVKHWWAARGIEITGMQALLFGTSGLNVFGPAEARDALLQRLSAVCLIGAGLGATRLVFGAPKNRDRNGLNDNQVMEIAIPFFRQIGNVAQACGVIFCLEPNPPRYGANFMTTSAETAEVVRKVAHPAIRMQLDTGAMTINREDPVMVLHSNATLIGHVHASEPDLVPLGDGVVDHATMAENLRQQLPEHIVTIEMLATNEEPHLVSVERALRVAVRHYRKEKGPDA
ncbi:MAG: sugar phosphate isomerase/epimerase family protein [Gallionellaceae bacterium]